MVHYSIGIAPIQNKSIYGSQSIYGLIINYLDSVKVKPPFWSDREYRLSGQ